MELLAELLLVGGLPFCASAEPDDIAVFCFPVYQSASRQATLHVCVCVCVCVFILLLFDSSPRLALFASVYIFTAQHVLSAFEFRLGEDRAHFNRSNSLG